MSTFEKIVEKIKEKLKENQGSDVRVSYATDKGFVEVFAFTAGGNVKPGSFRSTWYIDGVKMNKTEAKKVLDS